MGQSRKDDLFELKGLAVDGLGDLRMSMTVKVDPPAGDAIHEIAPVVQCQHDAFTGFDAQRRRPGF
jgi:hypothetical protein